MDKPTRPGGSWAVQGCLFGAVALFAVLLLVMIFLAYQRFREETSTPRSPPAVSRLVPLRSSPPPVVEVLRDDRDALQSGLDRADNG
jgi:hypothetical protein